jgi:hypothetical protein
MNPEDLEKVVEYLRNLASPVVEKGWELAYRQVLFNRIWDGLWIVICIALLVMGIILAKKTWKEMQDNNNDYGDDQFYGFLFAMAIGLGIAIPLLVIMSNVYEVLNFLLNPEWQVIEFITKTIGIQ